MRDSPCLDWPDQILNEPLTWQVLLRRGFCLHAQNLLLGRLVQESSKPELLAGLFLCSLQLCDLTASAQKLAAIEEKYPKTYLLSILRCCLGKHAKDKHLFNPDSSDLDTKDPWMILWATASLKHSLRLGLIASAEALFNFVNSIECIESKIAQAHYARSLGQLDHAYKLLLPVVQRAPHFLEPVNLILEIAMQGEMGDKVLPILTPALERHANHPSLLGFLTTTNLLRRMPGLARRSALKQRCWASIQPIKTHIDNQLTTYELNGLTHWLEYIHPRFRCTASTNLEVPPSNLHANMALQLASIGSDKCKEHLCNYVSLIRRSHQQQKIEERLIPLVSNVPRRGKLKILWMTSDFGPHPVGRFLLSFFEASRGCLQHDHVIISHADRKHSSYARYINDMPGLKFLDFSRYFGSNRVNSIRNQRADVAIDLNGWTAGQIISELMTRFAPIQVNYLGYPATSGLSEMDYWLGDKNLFPDPINEWHAESIWRMQRCFLSWQPSTNLPEAHVVVTPPPYGPICFGTFNHSRKFSDSTLRLWARIFTDLPEARLVLKAHSLLDTSTQTLLLRRMHRAGLPIDRIDWIPLTSTTKEHLQQYERMDIALDCLPYSGTTTTCEALWMGVPVITMRGDRYVSLQSTAVLMGAGLDEWIVQDEDSYVALAVRMASQLKYLRKNRFYWRESIKNSPLGDAADLMRSLEDAFLGMCTY